MHIAMVLQKNPLGISRASLLIAYLRGSCQRFLRFLDEGRDAVTEDEQCNDAW